MKTPLKYLPSLDGLRLVEEGTKGKVRINPVNTPTLSLPHQGGGVIRKNYYK